MLLRYYILLALLPSAVLADFLCCPGYKQEIANDRVGFKCVPKCKDDCGNGNCISPNSCSCDVGYTNKDRDASQRCVPDCDGGCGKGECIAPNTCAPICSSGCSNGYCEAPGKCSCNEGYAQADNQTDAACLHVCETECGKHRNCVVPNTRENLN